MVSLRFMWTELVLLRYDRINGHSHPEASILNLEILGINCGLDLYNVVLE